MEDKRHAYFTLGRLIHLLEDVSRRPHLQDDIHVAGKHFEAWEEYEMGGPGVRLNLGTGLETWGSKLDFGLRQTPPDHRVTSQAQNLWCMNYSGKASLPTEVARTDVRPEEAIGYSMIRRSTRRFFARPAFSVF